ncbi:MAG: sialidase family protein [Promethearchaeota archaeon]
MVQVNFSEVINLEQYFQISDISSISDFQFQVLPHGQHSFSFSMVGNPKIRFLRKEDEKSPWKLENYEFNIPTDNIPNVGKFQIQFRHQIDNQGNLILLYAIIHPNNLVSTLYYSSSHDYGKTWANSTKISPDGENWFPSGNLAMLEVGYHLGGLLVPVYNSLVNRLICLITSDNGKIWNFSLYVEPFEEITDKLEKENGDEFSSVGTKNGHVCELQDSRLFLFCHVQNSKDLHLAISKDVGATWSETAPIGNFPGILDGAGVFDCLNLLDLENSADNLYFLGNRQVENQFQVVLWKYNTIENQFDEKWAHLDLFKDPITQLYLYKEDNHIFHITFLSAEQKLYHYEMSKT